MTPKADLAPEPQKPDTASRPSEQEEIAKRLAADYLDTISGPKLISSAALFYGERVRFHGRYLTRAALIAEKSRYARRWPDRDYRRQGNLRTTCGADHCIVEADLGFDAASPARGARSRGLSSVTLTVSFGEGRPVIVSETSRVLRRGSERNATAVRLRAT